MKDRFEKFVDENRDEFDNEIPKERVWKRIKRKLDENPGSLLSIFLWKAAAVIFFGLSSFLLFQNYMQGQRSKDRLAEIALARDEFSEVEDYYISLISNKEQELDDFENSGESDYRTDLGNLDAIYQVLKEEMEKDPSKEVIDALILNLISRIDILNREVEKLSDEQNRQENSPAT